MRSRPGVYVLIVHLPAPATIETGRLGPIALDSGHYLYCGSAQGGLGPRLARHMRRDKVRHWHVDSLTAVAEPVGALLLPGGKEGECSLSKKISQVPGVFQAFPGFGCSDCGCATHLFHVPEGVPLVLVLGILRSDR